MASGTQETSERAESEINGFTANSTEIDSAAEQPKRKRGRPRKEESQKDSFTIQEEKVKLTSKAKRTKNFMTDSEAKNATEFALSLLEGFSVSALGNEARLNVTEKIILENSLPKLLTSIESSTVEKASNVLYPLAVMTGFTIYGLRLLSIYNAKEELKRENQESESSDNWQESTPITSNNLFSNLGIDSTLN